LPGSMKADFHLSRRELIQKAGLTLGFIPPALGLFLDPRNAAADPFQGARKDRTSLRELLMEMDAKGHQFWSVPWKDGEFLHFMVKATGSRHLLEMGTSHGFSAIWMALALEETDGRLVTIEIDSERIKLARHNIGRAGLSHRVTLVKGDGHAEIPKLHGPFDFIFLDADKGKEIDYFKKLYPQKLQLGGILTIHNAISQARSLKPYLEMIQKHPDFDTVILSATMDDGLCLSYRRRAS